MRLGLATALAFCAQAAVAECPTVADLERGIRVTFADGSHADFRREPGSIMVDRETPPPVDSGEHGFGYLIRKAHGFFPVDGGATDPNIMDTGYGYTYDVPAENLPLPGPGLRITVDWIMGAMFPSEGRSVYHTGPATSFTFGDCVFAGFEVTENARSRGVGLGGGSQTGNWVTGEAASIFLSGLQISIGLWSEYRDEERRVMPDVVSVAAIE